LLTSLTWSTDETLWQRWCRHAELTPDREAVVCVRAGEDPIRWTWARLVTRAREYAGWLQQRGVTPGQTCAIISRHHPEFFPVYLAIVALGGVPAVLAYPNARLHPDKFRDGLTGMARHSGLDWILTEAELQDTIRPVLAGEDVTLRGVLLPYEAALTGAGAGTPLVQPATAALLQHSSGTTGLQKAVVLSHRCVLEHAAHYGTALELRDDDRIVSWLPLYHDMGLIAALHMPLALGVPTIQLDPFEWIAAPVLLLQVLSSERGTLSWLPNFAYVVTAGRLHDDELEGVSLAGLRMLVNCSEPIHAQAHAALLARCAQLGLRREQLATCYAMAEATFAVTQSRPGIPCVELALSRSALAAGRATAPVGDEPSKICVSSGRAISGCEVRAVDADGNAVADGIVGEIIVRSVSLFEGYRGRPDKTAEVLRDGEYRTGDYGFCRDGEWFVVGRKKDLIIVAGKNLYPEDIEAELSTVEGVIPGRCVAFGRVDDKLGTERACVVVETEAPAERHEELRSAVIAAVQRIDVTIDAVYFVPARWLIKSSSGKPSRGANRDRILAIAETSKP
jgi:fatty-acyl-CoA synthase